jgi:BTB/POZ domain
MGESQAKSEIETNQLIYEWTIEKFSSLTTNIESEPFSLPTEETKCYINLYPDGHTPESKGRVSVFVFLNEQRFDMTLKVKFDLLSSVNSKTCSRNFTYEYLTQNSHGRGFSSFISRDDILKEANGYLVEDKLNLHCHISIIFEELLNGKDELLVRQQRLFKSGDFNDCAFVCPDGEVPANKFLLASQSTVFRAMFKGNTLEAMTGRIQIVDSNKDVMAVSFVVSSFE